MKMYKETKKYYLDLFHFSHLNPDYKTKNDTIETGSTHNTT